MRVEASRREEHRLLVALEADVEAERAVRLGDRDERRRRSAARAAASSGSTAFASASSGKYIRVHDALQQAAREDADVEVRRLQLAATVGHAPGLTRDEAEAAAVAVSLRPKPKPDR